MNERQLVPAELRSEIEAAEGTLGNFATSIETLRVTMPDGTGLQTDIYHPEGQTRGPVVLIRTPYGRRTPSVMGPGVFFASHGLRTVIQDCRGTTSFFDEPMDGATTACWLTAQSWWDDALFLHGASYHGFTAWATASRRPDGLQAISVQIYNSDRTSAWYPGGSFALDLALPWAALQTNGVAGRRGTDIPAVPDPGYGHLPLVTADVAQFGVELPFYRGLVNSDASDERWRPLDFSSVLPDIDVPVLLIGGWYDYQRRNLWDDLKRLDDHAAPHRIVFGPWGHLTIDQRTVNEEALAWFRSTGTATATGRTSNDGDRCATSARLYVTPDIGWLETDDLILEETTSLYLRSGGYLDREQQPAPAHVTYTYDPTQPTPAAGLDAFGDLARNGPVDNRALESRPDVLTFTTKVLDRAVEVVGTVDVLLYVSSTAPSTDFFARLTDVDAHGRSINVVDALLRVEDRQLSADTPMRLELSLGPAAHSFAAGHRLRLQVSSGAHPFYVRNLGITGPQAQATAGITAQQTVWFGGPAPSAVRFTTPAPLPLNGPSPDRARSS